MEKNAPARHQSVQPALAQAELLRSQGKRAEAEKIWSGLEDLYRDDPWGQELRRQIDEARKK